MKTIWDKFMKFSGVIAVVVTILALAAGWFFGGPIEAPVARGTYTCKVYTEQGCAKMVIASGGELEMQSGATLDVQSGVTAGIDVLSVGGGYGSTGCSISAAGVLQCNGAATTDGALTAASGEFGGGYGATGCSISAAGVLQCNGAATTDGALTAASATLGGGYGATGCTISSAGVLQCDGASTLGGAVTINDNATVTGTLGVDGIVTANADLIVDDVLNIDDTTYALTGTQTLNPTASFYKLTHGSILTLTLGTVGVNAGDMLILYNSTANNANIADTNVRTTTGSALNLGQYDVVAFVFDGTAWIELWLATNS